MTRFAPEHLRKDFETNMKTKKRMTIVAIGVMLSALLIFALKAEGEAAGKSAVAGTMPTPVTEGMGLPHGGRAGVAAKQPRAPRTAARQNNNVAKEGRSELVFDKTQPVRRAPETVARDGAKRIESVEIPREGLADPALFPLPKK